MDAGRRRELERKVYAGQRLDRADGIELYGCDDLVWLGRLAHHRRAHPDRTGILLGPLDGETGPRGLTTMSYDGGVEPGDWVDRLIELRQRQDASGSRATVVAVRRRTEDAAELGGQNGAEPGGPATPVEPTSPVLALRIMAVSRLVLDNVPHIAVLLSAEGPSLTQLALSFGADEVLAGADDGGDPATARDDLVTLVGDAGFRAVELDRDHGVVHEYDTPPTLAERRSEPQRVWA